MTSEKLTPSQNNSGINHSRFETFIKTDFEQKPIEHQKNGGYEAKQNGNHHSGDKESMSERDSHSNKNWKYLPKQGKGHGRRENFVVVQSTGSLSDSRQGQNHEIVSQGSTIKSKQNFGRGRGLDRMSNSDSNQSKNV